MFEKYSNTKFHENPSSGSLVVPCEQKKRQTDGRVDMAKPLSLLAIFQTHLRNAD